MTDTSNINPFDPEVLRLSQDFAAEVGVTKHLLRVPVRKPNRQEFIRVHPDSAYRLDTAIIEFREERETYLVAPKLRGELFAEITPARLFTTINRQAVVAIWPVKLPGQDGRANAWHETALQAAELAMRRWTKIVADMSLGGYQPYTAAADLPDPVWPPHPFEELLRTAFGQHHVDRPGPPGDPPAARRGVAAAAAIPAGPAGGGSVHRHGDAPPPSTRSPTCCRACCRVSSPASTA